MTDDKKELRRSQVRGALVNNVNARRMLADLETHAKALRDELHTLDSYEDPVIDAFPVRSFPEQDHLAMLHILLTRAQASVNESASHRAWLIGFDAAEQGNSDGHSQI